MIWWELLVSVIILNNWALCFVHEQYAIQRIQALNNNPLYIYPTPKFLSCLRKTAHLREVSCYITKLSTSIISIRWRKNNGCTCKHALQYNAISNKARIEYCMGIVSDCRHASIFLCTHVVHVLHKHWQSPCVDPAAQHWASVFTF